MTYFCNMLRYLNILLIMFCIVVVPGLTGRTNAVKPVNTGGSFIPELTLENVYRELLFKDVKYPEIVMRQVVWETQWLNCDRCSLKFNNLFGFATKKGYMHFDNWVASVDYYKKWQTKLHVEKFNDYYAFLVHVRYALGESYNRALRTLNINFITEKFQTASPDWLRRL
jgi:hypothetical protein